MAFTDFLDLRSAVVEQVGSERIVDVFPRIVKLAEVTFNRELRCREQITEATLTFTNGVASLPTDYLEAIGLYDSSGCEFIQQPPQNVRVSGTSGYYTIVGSEIHMTASDADRTLQYYAKVSTITDSMAGSNWLLQRHPGVYLYGAAHEAAKWLRDVELARATKGLLDAELSEARIADERDRYSRSRIRVAGVTP